MDFFFPKPDPLTCAKKWKRELQKEARMLDREIRGLRKKKNFFLTYRKRYFF
jgi:hypothetical protein